ncbi:SLAM family member 6-like isoform X2 [Lepisosteus oculatus]
MVTFTLEVYDPVSLPQVRVTSRGGTCFLECSVKNGREVTLLLKSRGRTLSHTVDPDLNAPLILHRELSESYSCVASNPASNESVTVHPDQHCGGASTSLLEGTLLNRAVGQSVSFEAPVFMRGFLQLDGLTIAEVSEKKTDEPPPRLRGRLTWDSQTGLFKISDLNPEDRGVYKVENFDGGVQDMVTFTLEVYDPVSLPQVRVTSHGGTCFLECSVKNGREVTLLLKSRGRTLSHTVDPDLNAPLILHRVTKELSESYSCVASNPASNESVTVHPDQYCGGLNTATIILCVMSVSLVLNAVMIIVLMYYKRKMKDEVARRREAEETFFDETVKL